MSRSDEHRRTVAAVFPAGIAVFLVLYETQVRRRSGMPTESRSDGISPCPRRRGHGLLPHPVLHARPAHRPRKADGAGVTLRRSSRSSFPSPDPGAAIVVRFLRACTPSVPASHGLLVPAAAARRSAWSHRRLHRRQYDRRTVRDCSLASEFRQHGGLAFTAVVSRFGLIVVWLLRHDLFSTARSRAVVI